jgi:8-hydroxy-5-deazaflavin:NADPH oxidoreductase
LSNIAVLGSGRVGSVLASKLAEAGHDVTIGSRNVDEVSGKWADSVVAVAEPAEAVGAATVIVNATPGDSAVARLSALSEQLAGKILIDVANATERGPDGMPAGLSYPNSSLAEHLQEALPDTRVVKTLNTMLFPVMVDPRSLKTPPTAFLSGDDEEAKGIVRQLLGDLGWPEEWIEDLGGIASARGPEAAMMLVPSIMRSRGMVPFAIVAAQ